MRLINSNAVQVRVNRPVPGGRLFSFDMAGPGGFRHFGGGYFADADARRGAAGIARAAFNRAPFFVAEIG